MSTPCLLYLVADSIALCHPPCLPCFRYLVVWDGFAAPAWRQLGEPELRAFLIERCRDGFAFPMNPVWPIRDPGWMDVLRALKASAEGSACLHSWFPPSSGVLARIDKLHASYPTGFRKPPPPLAGPEPPLAVGGMGKLKSAKSLLITLQDLSPLEMADYSIEMEVCKLAAREPCVPNAWPSDDLSDIIASLRLVVGAR